MNKKLKFWTPDSGVVGGIVFGFVIIFIAILLCPPLIKFLNWWQAVWGL